MMRFFIIRIYFLFTVVFVAMSPVSRAEQLFHRTLLSGSLTPFSCPATFPHVTTPS